MSQSRYAAYKDSGVAWLGQVPAHWQVVALKRTLDIQNGHDYKHIEVEDGYPVIGSGGIFACASDYLFDGESILLGRKGTIDKPLHFVGKFWTVDTMFWSKIDKAAHGRFIYYVATEIPFEMYSTNTALPSMAKSVLEQHLIPLPPLAEQQAIAAFLDRECARIDALVAAQQHMIALLKEKRQAQISHAVTHGLDPAAPRKDSGVAWLGQVPAHWQMKKIKSLTKFSSGGTPSRDEPSFWNGDIPWVSAKDMKSKFISSSEEFITHEGLQNTSGSIIPEGAVLMVVRSGILKHTIPVAINTVPVTINQDLKCIVLTNECTNIFFYYWITGNNSLLLHLWSKQGATVESIEHEYMVNTLIPLPPLAEQQAIAAFLDRECARIDTLIGKAEQAIALLHERRSALIAAAVTGQIRVDGVE